MVSGTIRNIRKIEPKTEEQRQQILSLLRIAAYHPDPDVRKEVLRSSWPKKEVTPGIECFVLNALEDPDPYVRAAAINEAVGNNKLTKKGWEYVKIGMQDPDPDVRKAAMDNLSGWNNSRLGRDVDMEECCDMEELWSVMKRATNDPSEEVQSAALGVLNDHRRSEKSS